jgi:hypothetical protein
VLTGVALLRHQLQQSRKTVMKIVKQPLSRKADRQADIRKKLATFDGIADLQEEFSNYIAVISTNLGDDVVLNENFAQIAMRMALATQHIEEVAEVAKRTLKGIVFDHMNAVNAENPDIEDPVNVNAKLPVPAMGMEFSREGAGVNYTANVPALKKVLAEAGIDWTSVFNAEHKVVYTLNTDALWTVIKDNDTLQDEVREIIEETPKSARLNLRPMKPEDVEE